jgi:hypothetical protein
LNIRVGLFDAIQDASRTLFGNWITLVAQRAGVEPAQVRTAGAGR